MKLRRDEADVHRFDETAVELIDVQSLASLALHGPAEVAVIMPCIDTAIGLKAATFLATRAGMACRIIVVEDTLRQGFIKTLNDTAARISARYVVYVAQDAYPGRDWLRSAYEIMEQSGKGLLGFNDGKFRGRIATFGMVRREWIESLYGGPVLFPGYHSHAADNELTVIARALDMYIYEPDCTLIEYDLDRESKPSRKEDCRLFRQRYVSCFDGLAPLEPLVAMAREYKIRSPVIASNQASDGRLSITGALAPVTDRSPQGRRAGVSKFNA